MTEITEGKPEFLNHTERRAFREGLLRAADLVQFHALSERYDDARKLATELQLELSDELRAEAVK